MPDSIRDGNFGHLVRWVTGNKVLLYPEEKEDFQLPDSYIALIEGHEPFSKEASSSANSQTVKEKDALADPTLANEEGLKPQDEDPFKPQVLEDGTIIVNWYNADDPANPQNWSSGKKLTTVIIINLYTFAVYLGSSIITGSYGGMMERFGISMQVVSLTLSMFVLAYGLGPMLWSPLSEIPSWGRNPLYIVTFAVFTILLIPTALADNFPGLVVLRFLLGFFGSPCLATGPASLGDMYGLAKLPYVMVSWALAAVSGPALGPVLSSYSVPKTSWRWATWELLWLSGPLWLAFFFLVPETSHANILLRRAQRLRARTGHTHLKSQGEIDQSKIQPRQIITEALWRPIQTMFLDPSIGFTALYVALIYGTYYSFFECFPMVYIDGYGFSLGSQGLIYLSISVGIIVGVTCYCIWLRLNWEPSVKAGYIGLPERRLLPALVACFFLPIGLFLFAWTAKPSIHWVVPTIGIAILSAGIFLITQGIFLYLPLSYPQYAASVFAGNSAARSLAAAIIVHASQPLYINLGIDRGVSLLGALTVGCIAGMFGIWYYGPTLRARSKFTP